MNAGLTAFDPVVGHFAASEIFYQYRFPSFSRCTMPPPPNVHEARRRLRDILRRAEKFGIARTELAHLPAARRLRGLAARRSSILAFLQHGSAWVLLITAAACASIAALFFCYSGGSPLSGGLLPDAARQQQYQALVSLLIKRWGDKLTNCKILKII